MIGFVFSYKNVLTEIGPEHILIGVHPALDGCTYTEAFTAILIWLRSVYQKTCAI